MLYKNSNYNITGRLKSIYHFEVQRSTLSARASETEVLKNRYQLLNWISTATQNILGMMGGNKR